MGHKTGGIKPVTQRAVVIIDVDLPNRSAHVQDKTGGRVIAGFRYMHGANQIPQQGEWWIIERNTSTEWHFVHRLDSLVEHDDLMTMSPGDTRVRAPGKIHLRGQGITVSSDGSVSGSKPLGATRWQTRTTGSTVTTWTLAEAPVSIQTVMLFDNGTLIAPDGLSLDGALLTGFSVATGHKLVVYYQVV